ncbi:site-specific DNA-methyltransferase [Nocardia otitidiscaviarum]|nr:site-specific DNA-methyltransferase [Nocardia otitidiscaviarum]
MQALLARVEASDPATAKELRRHVETLTSRRQFGLNFERHVPEQVQLVGRSISVGDKVRFIPPRGEAKTESDATWLVTNITGPNGARIAGLLDPKTKAEITRPVDDLVFVADFREPIYPGLVSTGKVERGGDKPFHTVIQAENYHALEAVLFTHQSKVDCIYIDPPYNTGARDWKYNNNYVDGEDSYRHSKWLAFMERRLKLAKRLLNPIDSVLIVTIDEKEYLRLGLLLEQIFPEARIQMISSVINPKGATRSTAFGRTDEYVYFVMLGRSAPRALPLGNEWKVVRDSRAERIRWAELLRSGTNAKREDRPRLFYPIFLRNTKEGPIFDSVGENYLGADRDDVVPPDGCVAVWPIRSDGSEGNWQISASALVELIGRGYAKVGGWREERTTISYLKRGEQSKVEGGLFPVLGRRADGSIVVDSSEYEPVFIPGTQWRIASHEAGGPGGTGLLRSLIPGRRFPFPKSVFAVEDALRFFVADKPDALIVDFFSGSGTTAHAVMRLNRHDGSRRRSISVTNNEVSVDEQTALHKLGLRPGDPEWEVMGICEYITKPRLTAAVTGKTPDGSPIKGSYNFTDEFPIADGLEENVEFFILTYENPALIELDMAFERIAPLLWMRAGSEGRRIDKRSATFEVADTYAVLFNMDASREFLSVVDKTEGLRAVYVVTDDETQYQAIVGQLPDGIESVQLYESYLRTFKINTERV